MPAANKSDIHDRVEVSRCRAKWCRSVARPLATRAPIAYDHDMTKSTINITADMIITRARTEIFICPDTDFLQTLDAHDDAAHFADLDLIELRDDLDLAIMIFCPADATDAAIDDFADRYAACIDEYSDAIFAAILDAINIRTSLLRP